MSATVIGASVLAAELDAGVTAALVDGAVAGGVLSVAAAVLSVAASREWPHAATATSERTASEMERERVMRIRAPW